MAQEKINTSAGQTARAGSYTASRHLDLLFPTGDFTPFTLNSFFGTRGSGRSLGAGPSVTVTTMFDLTATN